MRRLVVASAILATLLSAPLSLAAAIPATAAAPTDAERATSALEYLWAVQKPDGSIGDSASQTADFVIGTAAAGYDPATLLTCKRDASALGYLATASDAKATDAATTGKAILAVVAAGLDPAAFQGRDLEARLAALYNSSTGAYGDGSTYSQAFAILGSEAAKVAIAPEAVAELKALQDADGSWSYGTAKVPDGQGDTNSTAIAVMALDAAGDHSADAAALTYLHTQQLADGGFPFQNPSAYGPAASDADSDAGVIQALVAAAEDPEGAAWLKGTNSVLTQLRSTQGADGGFAYPGSAEDALTTSQVPAALVRVPYAGSVHWTVGRALQYECISTPATATPRPTPKPTPKPTARPTVRPTARPTVSPTEPPAVAVATETPAPTPAQTPAPTEQLAAVQASGPIEQVAGVTFAPGNPTPGSPAPEGPSPLLYGAVAVVSLIAVAGGGWLYLTRPWTR